MGGFGAAHLGGVVVLVELKLTDDVSPLVGTNQSLVIVMYTVDGTFEVFFPKLKKISELGVVWCQIVVLPDVGSENTLVIWQTIGYHG